MHASHALPRLYNPKKVHENPEETLDYECYYRSTRDTKDASISWPSYTCRRRGAPWSLSISAHRTCRRAVHMSHTDWEIQTRAVEISCSALWLPAVAIGNIYINIGCIPCFPLSGLTTLCDIAQECPVVIKRMGSE